MKNEEYPKTDFRFREFLRDEDGRLVRLETVESAIPVNVFADDGSDFDLREGELCSAELIGDAYELKVYKDEATFRASESGKKTRLTRATDELLKPINRAKRAKKPPSIPAG